MLNSKVKFFASLTLFIVSISLNNLASAQSEETNDSNGRMPSRTYTEQDEINFQKQQQQNLNPSEELEAHDVPNAYK